MKSPDLKNWTSMGLLMHPDMPDNLGVKKEEDVSCANMFRIGNKWMLLCFFFFTGNSHHPKTENNESQ